MAIPINIDQLIQNNTSLHVLRLVTRLRCLLVTFSDKSRALFNQQLSMSQFVKQTLLVTSINNPTDEANV